MGWCSGNLSLVETRDKFGLIDTLVRRMKRGRAELMREHTKSVQTLFSRNLGFRVQTY